MRQSTGWGAAPQHIPRRDLGVTLRVTDLIGRVHAPSLSSTMVGRPTYPSVPPIDGNVPVSLSWDSKKTRTMVWYGKKATMRKSFQFDEHDELTTETVEAQVRAHHMFAEVLAAHSPSNQPVGESAAAASDAATLEASIRQEEARQAGEISEKYIMYEDRPNTRSDAERLAPDRLEATEELRDKATGGVAGGVGRVAQGEAAGRCPRRSARAVARGALLAGGAQGEGVHAGRGHGRQH